MSTHAHTAADIPGLTPTRAGLLVFLCSEAAFFCTLMVTYGIYIGRDTSGPTPDEVLSMPLVLLNSVFLLSSSGTIALALKSREKGSRGGYRTWLAITILLGVAFLIGTGYEWYGLIFHDGLTISTNLFGSTFYTLIGFHGFHVSVGLIVMMLLFCLEGPRGIHPESDVPELVSWYWHFVDAIWVVILLLVYIFGR